MKVAWVSTWDRVCGIADYSKELWPLIQKTLVERGDEGVLFSLDRYKGSHLIRELKSFSPDVVHFQHEYSFFGGKNPPFYTFPYLIERLRRELPNTKFIATAHTVMPENYRFPILAKKWQIPFRILANAVVLKKLKEFWGAKTWGRLDGTIVHSQKQVETVKKAGTPYAEAIPLFTPSREKISKTIAEPTKNVVVFGFFTYDKGQDIVIEAFKYLKELPEVHLILAGGARDKQNQGYLNQCEAQIKGLGLESQITITGYLNSDDLNKNFAKADLVVVPFRLTSGSASLVHSLGRGLPVLASDLPLNLEISERVPGTLEYFENENPEDLARKIKGLIFNRAKLDLLRQGALRYAATYSPSRVAFQHLHVYDTLVK